jgi:hypothetical protein
MSVADRAIVKFKRNLAPQKKKSLRFRSFRVVRDKHHKQSKPAAPKHAQPNDDSPFLCIREGRRWKVEDVRVGARVRNFVRVRRYRCW